MFFFNKNMFKINSIIKSYTTQKLEKYINLIVFHKISEKKHSFKDFEK